MGKNKILFAGKEEYIDKILDYAKENNLIGKDKLFLVDIFPDLTDECYEEQGLN